MCLFCGGSCAGSGDVLLISLAAGIGLTIVKLQSMRAARKKKDPQTAQDKETDTKSASEQQDADS